METGFSDAAFRFRRKLGLLLGAAFFCGPLVGFGASLQGTVEGPRGLLPGAEVTLQQPAGPPRVLSTDSQGRFRFDQLDAGLHHLQVIHWPYLPFVSEVAVATGTSEVELTVVLQVLNETVTVTASRQPAPVALSVSEVKILRGEDLRQMPYQALDEALRTLPEFSLFRRASSLVSHPTTQGVSLRGIGPSGVSRSLVLADGVPLNDAFGGWVYWDRIPSLSLEQVEVANGGGSSLYGNYGLGGVVQLLKRIPAPATLEFQGQGGSRQALKGDLYTSHRLGPWGLSVAGSVFDFDGYPIVAASQRGTVDIAAFSRHQALRVYNEWAPAGGSWAGSLEAGLLNEHRGNGTPLQTNDTVSYDFSATAQWSASPRDRLETRAFFRRTIFQSNFSAVAADRNSERLTTQQHVPSADGGASLLWYATRGRHQVTAGTDLWVVSGASTENVFFGQQVGAIRVGSGKQATVGIFAEENYAISPRTALVVGGRVDTWKNFDGQQGSFPPGSRQLAALEGTTLAVFSPRAGLTHEFSPRFSLYGSVYRSFRAPTLNELYRGFRVGNITTNPNSKLEPEYNLGGELGWRAQASDKIRTGLVGFLSVMDQPVSNVTVETRPSEIIRQRQNLGRVRIYGLQASLGWNPTPRLRFDMAYLWNRSRVTEFAADSRLVGNSLPQVAEHRWSFNAQLHLPQAFLVALAGRVIGDQFDDDLNRVVLDRYFALDTYLSRSLGETAQVFLALENLTDARILVNRSPVDTLGAPFQIRGGILLRPRLRN